MASSDKVAEDQVEGSQYLPPLKSKRREIVKAADPAETPTHELLTEDMVNVYVGPNQKKFHLHKDLLCDRSTYFKHALNGGFKEQDDKAVYLPDDDVECFGLFTQWIYGVPLQKTTAPAAMEPLLALYVIAEKFCVEQLKNASMDVLRASYQRSTAHLLIEHIEYIYSNTPESSPMRRFLVNYMAYSLFAMRAPMPEKLLVLIKKGGDFSGDFASVLLQYSLRTPGHPLREKNCAYHEHISSGTCL